MCWPISVYLMALNVTLPSAAVRNGLDKLRVLALNLAQLKTELTGRKVAPGQRLGHVNLVW